MLMASGRCIPCQAKTFRRKVSNQKPGWSCTRQRLDTVSSHSGRITLVINPPNHSTKFLKSTTTDADSLWITSVTRGTLERRNQSWLGAAEARSQALDSVLPARRATFPSGGYC